LYQRQKLLWNRHTGFLSNKDKTVLVQLCLILKNKFVLSFEVKTQIAQKIKPFFLKTEKPDLLRNISTVENEERFKSKNFDL